MRTPLIAGNWKMNNNIEESLNLIQKLVESSMNDNVDVLVCPPLTALYVVKEALNGSKIKLGAQNMHYEKSGAYTGEVSATMLKDIGVDFCLIGHSERRKYFNETDDMVNKKLKASIDYGIKPILCVGESLAEREKGIEKTIIKNQLVNAFKDIKEEDASKIVVAYEPIWAIGTGKTASSDQANEIAYFIRCTMEEIYNVQISQNMLVLYGGSVKGDNATEIMNKSDIDGALVGGASLKADEFLKIINFAHKL